MKIIINAYQFSKYITGTDRMAANYLNQLQKMDKVNDYYVICSLEPFVTSTLHEKNFIVMHPPQITRNRLIQRLINKAFKITINARLFFLKPDVYFSFHNMTLPRWRVAKKMIASNLDLIPLVLDEYKDDSIRKVYQRTTKRADIFVSISEFSKKELIRILDVSAEKIKVISLAADPLFKKKETRVSQKTQPYLLTVGGAEPRKNVRQVISTFKQLPLDIQKTYPLYIVGPGWRNHSLDELGNDPNIKKLGFVSEDRLQKLYQNARVFIFASKYEGFGFAILEAMASGTPVVCRGSTSLMEVGGNAALYYTNSDELGSQLLKLIKDAALHRAVVTASLEQSKNFSWEISAKKLLAIFEK